MKKQHYLVIAFLMLIALFVKAQQSLLGGQSIISPEINKDNSVIFRLNAPNAREVQLSGVWTSTEY